MGEASASTLWYALLSRAGRKPEAVLFRQALAVYRGEKAWATEQVRGRRL